MKGHRFDNFEEVKKKIRKELSAISKDYYKKKCFEHWKHRWDKCISCNLKYFEGDKVVL